MKQEDFEQMLLVVMEGAAVWAITNNLDLNLNSVQDYLQDKYSSAPQEDTEQ